MSTNNSINAPSPTGGVAIGGTGNSGLTAHAVLVGAGTGSITQLAVGGNNSIMMGNASADPAFTTTGTPYVTALSFDSGTNKIQNYAEGTWTPTMVGSGVAGTTTYVAQNGYYVRVGNLVFCYAYIQISGATGTGAPLYSLPFTVKNQAVGFMPGGAFLIDSTTWTWPAGRTMIAPLANQNTTNMSSFTWKTSGSQNQIAMNNSAATFRYSIAYEI